jgi:endonuclease/exonuclease/phosphatase family metal-dependent hydrolase
MILFIEFIFLDMKIATLNIDWSRKKNSLKTEEFLNQFDFDFLILTEAIDLNLKNFPYKYLCSQIPENIIYENLNYTEYLNGEKAYRTILYSKIPYSKKYQVTDDKTNLALEFETELGKIVIYSTIIGTWFNKKPFVDNELQNTIHDCKNIHSMNKNLFIVGDFNTSFRKGEEKFSINSKTTKALTDLFDGLNLINATQEIKENIDHVVIPKTFVSNIIEVKSFVDKNIWSDHQGVFVSIQNK